ncbi:MAG: hypothetical protein JWO94_3003 [Verrucomicrobiaceae bacterium]|nr:hypothetical protein [Verrucomicrobiaceae bacterium]
MKPLFYPATSGDFFLAALERFMRSSKQGEHFGATVLRLKSRPDMAALRSAWERIFELHPVIGGQLQRRWRGWQLGWRVTQPLPAPPLVMHEGTTLSDAVILERLGGKVPATPLSLEVFLPPDQTCQILISWKHGIIDGMGLAQLLEQLGGQTALVAAPPAKAPPRPSFSKIAKGAKPAIKVLRQMTCVGSRSAWHRGEPLPGDRGFQVIELDAAQSAAAFAVQRRYGGEFFHMPFYAAITARALRLVHEMRSLPQGYCHLEVPYQVGRRPPGAVFQNQMATLLLPLLESEMPTRDAAVAHVLAVYKAAMKGGQPQATAALMALVMNMPAGLFIPFIRFQNVGEICGLFHSHTGTFLPGGSTFAGSEVDNVFNIPSVCTPPGLGIFFSDFAGRITLTLAWRGDSLQADELAAVSRQIVEDLTQ